MYTGLSRARAVYYVRLGRFVKLHPDMLVRDAILICATWRAHFAWHLWRELATIAGLPMNDRAHSGASEDPRRRRIADDARLFGCA